MLLVRSRMTEKPSSIIQVATGGVLMGLANLVPGVSGGTMLLVTGIYTEFITAIADVTRLRWRASSLLFLSAVVGAAASAILLLAGPTKTLVIEQRWIMYSLFIGLTLGGVPLIWRLAQPVSKSFFVGTGAAFALMVLVALGHTAQVGQEERSLFLLFIAGLVGASAMILPGVSGGYLLLLLGQYVPILSGIEKLKMGLIGAGEETGLNWPVLNEALAVVVPVGIGVVVGVVGVSNLIRWLLEHYRTATLGVLMGLILGAVVGLWPFQTGIKPQVGDMVKGQIVTPETRIQIEVEDWPVRFFTPSPGQIGSVLMLICIGLGATLGLDRFNTKSPQYD